MELSTTKMAARIKGMLETAPDEAKAVILIPTARNSQGSGKETS